MATNIDPNQDQSADSGRVIILDKNINATSKEVGSSERKFYGFTKPDYGRDKSYERRLIRTATRYVRML